MNDTAWLELPSGKTMPIEGMCAIGRAPSNQLRLNEDHVSRHHAVIRTTEAHECWIVDLGSANGTYVNQRRINSQRLRNGDTISIGSCVLVFRTPGAGDRDADDDLLETVHEIQPFPAWLFLADIEGSTDINRRLGPHQMELAHHEWLTRCRAILQDTGGVLDKVLGDGFFAFWPQASNRSPEWLARSSTSGIYDLPHLFLFGWSCTLGQRLRVAESLQGCIVCSGST